jgi:hypothetical protein
LDGLDSLSSSDSKFALPRLAWKSSKEAEMKMEASDPGLAKTVKVKFNGEKYWLLQEGPSGGRALAYLDHCDIGGNLTEEGCFQLSFAHLIPNGKIMRFQQVIGSQEELEIIN